jgi:hypothetical protein
MNPYLEQDDLFHDFHQAFCTLCRELLVPQVRPAFYVKMDEHVYIHELSGEERRLVGRAEVSVARPPNSHPLAAPNGTLTAPATVRVPVAVDEQRESFLEIRDRQTHEVVTVIELLSLSNKRTGPDREQYLAKRQRILASWVNLVEIDLLRGGPRLPVIDLPPCDYYALVSRYPERPQAGVWPIRLREPLPVIPIPLRAPHPDAQLDLQQMLHRLYDAAGYEDYIYTGEPDPALSAEDAAWAQALLPARS